MHLGHELSEINTIRSKYFNSFVKRNLKKDGCLGVPEVTCQVLIKTISDPCE